MNSPTPPPLFFTQEEEQNHTIDSLEQQIDNLRQASVMQTQAHAMLKEAFHERSFMYNEYIKNLILSLENYLTLRGVNLNGFEFPDPPQFQSFE